MNINQNDLKSITDFRNVLISLTRRLRTADRNDHQNWTTLMILGAIQRAHGEGTPKKIAEDLSIRPSNLANSLRELELRELLLRTPDNNDKRKIRLSLTPEGLKLVSEARERRDIWLKEAMEACLSREEQAYLLATGPLIQRLLLFREDGLHNQE